MYRLNDNSTAEDSKENNDTLTRRQTQGLSNNTLQWQDTGIIQVSADTREKMIQNQKDAVLRRRRQQFHSGFIKSFNNTQTTMRKLESDPHVVPTVKTYYSTSKQVSVCNEENQRQQPPHLQMNTRGVNNDRITKNTISFKEKKTVESQEVCPKSSLYETVVTDNNSFPDYATESPIFDEEKSPRTYKQLKRSPSTLSNMNYEHYEGTDFNLKKKQNSVDIESQKSTSDAERGALSNHDEEPAKISEDARYTNDVWKRVDWSNVQEVRKILMAPCPKEAGMVKCYIRRYKGKAKLFPEYRVYLQDGDIFLMTSKKRAKKQTSNYLISIERNNHNKSSQNIIGKLRANFLGTEFQIYDNGKNPKHFDPFFDENNNDVARSELGAILYTGNLLGNRQPRKMQVCINRTNNEGKSTKQWQPAHKDEEMINVFKHKTEVAAKHLCMYENRQPKWNEDLGSYVLNFNKRVNLASVKNFQLITPNNEEQISLQFGKASNDEFIMDVQWPISLFQAFAICLSSFDSKIACD